MARWVKRWHDMVENPRGWSYADAATVLHGIGFVPPSKPSGSHRWWRHPIGCRVGIPDYGHGHVPVEYIKDMVRLVRTAGLEPTASSEDTA
ncbi:hypothetical protein tb265_20240 [Gemmatimonadetes bacterium T265]|nr:hypothetical protein tb265_20240 [Gemmatimonadetes bacterium T265]